MELVPKPKLTTVLSESRRLIKSHRRRFSVLFLALFFVGLLSLALSSAASGIASLFGAGDGDSVPTGSDDDHNRPALIWSSMIGIFLINLVFEIFSLLAGISVTSVALRSFNEEPDVGPNSVAKSIRASFFPIVATSLLQLAISFLVVLGFTMIVVFVAISAYFLGFQIDPESPFVQLLAITFAGFPSLLVVAYLNFVSWGLVTPVIVAESTWGFAALKRSKTLVNGKRFIAVILFLIFAVSYTVVDRIGKPFSAVAGDLEETKSFVAMALIFVAQLVVTSSLSSMVKLYEIVATTLFYVFCKAVHEEGLYYGDSQYVKLAVDDSGSKLGGGYGQV